MSPGVEPGRPQAQLGPLVREGGREELARLRVDAHAVHHRPVHAGPDDGVEVAQTARHQVHFVRGLLERV